MLAGINMMFATVSWEPDAEIVPHKSYVIDACNRILSLSLRNSVTEETFGIYASRNENYSLEEARRLHRAFVEEMSTEFSPATEPN